MALRRTLEMLKAGERINDLLYRSTVEGSRKQIVRRWAYSSTSDRIGPALARRAKQKPTAANWQPA